MAATVTPMRTAAETALLQRFPEDLARMQGRAALRAVRQHAFTVFARSGLPNRRVEEWKYTDLRAAMAEVPPLADPAAAAARPVPPSQLGVTDTAATIAFADGLLIAAETAGRGGPIAVRRLGEPGAGDMLAGKLGSAFPAAADNAAVVLNTAFLTDAALITVAPGANVEAPIRLVFAVGGERPSFSAPRVLIEVGEGAKVTIVEEHLAARGATPLPHQVNAMVEIVAGAGATVEHVRLNRLGPAAIGLSTLAAELGRGTRFDAFSMNLGAALARHQVFVRFAGEHAEAGIRGAALLHGRQHADVTLVVDHAVPHGTSRELFKTVLDGESTGVFQGRINVAPHAQKTDGKMMSRALLLSEGASMNNKPELEIFADDVVCGHGATCGAIDEDLMFYLMARGIPRPEAEALLIHSFVGEAIEAIGHEAIREALSGLVGEWLAARPPAQAAPRG